MKCLTVALLFLLSIPGLAAPKQPAFELIEVPGSVDTRPRGINDNGDISGYYTTETNFFGFIKKGDQFTTLSVPGSLGTQAYGIDNQGRVSGNFYEGSFEGPGMATTKGFIYENGQYTIVSHPDANFYGGTNFFGISEGRVVGIYSDSSFQNHGFIYSNGEFTLIDKPGASITIPYGINAAGRVIGRYSNEGSDSQTQHGFAWQNGVFETIDFPRPGALTELYAVNRDTILGSVGSNDTECHGFGPFILRHGKFSLLDLPGVQLWAMNNDGLIVGDYGRNRGFVAKASSFILRDSGPSLRLSQRNVGGLK